MRVLLVAFVGLFLFLMVPQGRAAEASGLKPTYLRCEYLVNPLGIDVPEPRLSWIVESGERGQKQTAYQVLVAGNEDGLKKDQGDLWDSGKVSSDDTTAIVYAGRKLASRQRCYWKVKVWDREGRPSAWSEPSLWSMGLLAPAEWTGQWIGYDKHRHVDRTDAPFEGAKWIWFPDQGKEAKGMRLFVTSFNLSPNTPVEKAQLYVTANGQFSVHINSHKVVSNGPDSSFESPRGADVANRLIPGVNDIRVGAEVPAKGPAGLLVKLEVKTADGQTHTLVSDDSWKTTDQLGEDWHKRPLDTSSWPASKVLGEYGASPWGKLKYVDLFPPPPAYLRTGFQAHKPIRHATVYATALGLFDLYLNGRRVTDDRLNPGWSDYHKRLYYRAYDVTDLVRSGDNALGALLADGWYSGYIGWGRVREHYGKHPRLRAQLYLDYADGSQAIIATGPNWK
ncbi:MAG: alpha-L-rhamnosidase N-terminal domain-containing protein, partial [Planctomycetes bacterium]|nr:alpha-L-rhamnosidase N-terminal domain-containing protein [Planctomycetota bacterium]